MATLTIEGDVTSPFLEATNLFRERLEEYRNDDTEYSDIEKELAEKVESFDCHAQRAADLIQSMHKLWGSGDFSLPPIGESEAEKFPEFPVGAVIVIEEDKGGISDGETVLVVKDDRDGDVHFRDAEFNKGGMISHLQTDYRPATEFEVREFIEGMDYTYPSAEQLDLIKKMATDSQDPNETSPIISVNLTQPFFKVENQ